MVFPAVQSLAFHSVLPCRSETIAIVDLRLIGLDMRRRVPAELTPISRRGRARALQSC
jgi:hypothetical protein